MMGLCTKNQGNDMRQKARLLAKGWEGYRIQVIPQAATEEQLRESRRSFYAGAHLLLCDILELLDPGDEPTEGDLAMVEDLQDELAEFAVSVVEGRA
jgi:hypothetical protein